MKNIGIVALFSFLVLGLSLNTQVALAQSSDPDMQHTETSKAQTRREKRQERRKGGGGFGSPRVSST